MSEAQQEAQREPNQEETFTAEEEDEEEEFLWNDDDNYEFMKIDEDFFDETDEELEEKEKPKKITTKCDYDFDVDFGDKYKQLCDEDTKEVDIDSYKVDDYEFQLKIRKDVLNGNSVYAIVVSDCGLDADICIKIGSKFIFNHYAVFAKTSTVCTLKPELFKLNEINQDDKFNGVLSFHFTPSVYLTRDYFGCVGLQNSGMTCYLNSLIQCLFHLRIFRKIVFSIDNPKSDIANNLKLLFGRMQSMSGPVSTRELTKSFGWEIEDLFSQQDTQELMRLLLDRLDDSCHNKTSDLFKGVLSSFIKCPEANYESSHDEDFCDLSLQVDELSCLEDSIKAYFQTDKLTGDDKYQLPDGRKVDAEVGSKLKTNSQILCLHLRRFQYKDGNLKKLNTRFSFPSELEFGGDLYQLHSIISHHGNVFGGHYNAFVKINGIWTNFDDENVRHCEEHEAIDENFGCGDRSYFTAYVLFYVKPELINIEEPEIPLDILQKEEKRKSEIKISLTVSVGKDPFRTVSVNKNYSSDEFKEFISKETSIPIEKLTFRKVTNGEIGDIIDEPIPIQNFHYFVGDSADLPIFCSIYIPGYEIIPLCFIFIKPNETVEELSNKLFDYLGIEHNKTKGYFDFGQNELGSIATGKIDECCRILFELDNQCDVKSLIEPIKKIYPERVIPFKQTKEPSHFNLLDDIKVNSLGDFFSYIKNNRIMNFKPFKEGKEFKLELACCLTFNQILKCISNYLKVDQNKILLFLPDKYDDGPSFHNIHPDVFPTFAQLSYQTDLVYYEIADIDIRGHSRADITIINDYQTSDNFPLYLPKRSKISELNDILSRKLNTKDFILYYIQEGFPILISNYDEEISFHHKICAQVGINNDSNNNILLRVIHYEETFNYISSKPNCPFFIKVSNETTLREIKNLEIFKGKHIITFKKDKRSLVIDEPEDGQIITTDYFIGLPFKINIDFGKWIGNKQMKIKKEKFDDDENSTDDAFEEEETFPEEEEEAFPNE